jgi:hypothetical protein
MIPLLLGTALGPILAKAGIGASLGLGATGLGGIVAGTTSLLQGNGPLQAALDAFGGGGGAGALSNLAKTGAAANAVSSGAQAIPTSSIATTLPQGVAPAVADIGRSSALTSAANAPFSFSNVGTGLKDLFADGGAKRFAEITGDSALSSVGVPAAGLAMSALTPPTAMPAGEMSFDLGPFTPLSELRRQDEKMGYAGGGIAVLNPMHGMFDARNGMPEYGEPKKEYKKGGYLDGPGDGMSDDIPATIEGKQPARLADGEFVVPADVVSHLGNGSTKAGAKRLYAMMAKVRTARTGNAKQGKQIDPNKYLPA